MTEKTAAAAQECQYILNRVILIAPSCWEATKIKALAASLALAQKWLKARQVRCSVTVTLIVGE